MNKTVVIINPESLGWNLATKAKELGRFVIIAVIEPVERYRELKKLYHIDKGTAKGLCDELIVEPDWRLLASRLAERAVIAVIPGSEIAVEYTDRLASALGQVCNDPQTSMDRRDKCAMKLAMGRANLAHASGGCFDVLEAALDFAERNLTFPVVVKPTSGASGQNVFVCRNRESLIKRFSQVLGDKDDYLRTIDRVIVEQYIEGREYAVNLFGNGTETVVTDIWEYRKFDNEIADNIYYSDILLDVGDPEFFEMKEYAKKFYSAVGLTIGPAHAEIKVNPSGIFGIEIGGRLAGGNLAKFVSHGENLDLFDMTLALYENRPVKLPDPIVFTSHVACADLSTEQSGMLTRIDGCDQIRGLSSFLDMELFIAPGDRIEPTTNFDTILGMVWLKNADLDHLRSDIDAVHELFRIQVK